MIELNGVIPALFTPFSSNGSVNLTALAKLVRFQLNAGVGGFYVTGASGEWVKLSIEERKLVAGAVVREVGSKVPVVIHIGHFSTAASLELCRHAVEIGADMISAEVPGYYSYTAHEIREYYRAISRIGLPVIVYYSGSRVAPLDPLKFLQGVADIDNIVGLKYTAADYFPMQNILDLSA